MIKLTQQNKNYFKSIMFDMIYRVYHLDNMKYYKVDIKIKNDKTFNDNDYIIDIMIKTQLHESRYTNVYIYHFRNTTMCNYSQYKLNDINIVDGLNFDIFTLAKVNIVNDNVKEFYKNLED